MPDDHSSVATAATRTQPATQQTTRADTRAADTTTHTAPTVMSEHVDDRTRTHHTCHEHGVFDHELDLVTTFATRERALSYARLIRRAHPDRPVHIGHVEHHMIITGVVEIQDGDVS